MRRTPWLTVAAGAAAGARPLAGHVKFQACNDQVCLAPASVPFTLALAIAGEAGAGAGAPADTAAAPAPASDTTAAPEGSGFTTAPPPGGAPAAPIGAEERLEDAL